MMLTKTTSSKTENFSYDGLNQLIGYTDGTTSASYAYNIEGLRVRKTVNGQSVKHIWDSNKQIAVEYNPDEDVYTADVYVRGTNLLANFSYSHGAKSDYHYYSQNAHGDVVNISDSSSAIIKSYSYDAFGVEKNIDESDTNCFRYCGEYYDKETGTVYLRARYYNPGIGRFISRDSFTGKNEDPLSLNLYTYCHNNPVIGIDPSGHIPYLAIGAIAGALICGGITLASEIAEKGIRNLDTDTAKKVGISLVGGAIGGALAASGVQLGGQIIGNALIGAGSNLADCALNKHPVNALSLTIDTVAGGIGGVIGGSGAEGGKLMYQFKNSNYHLQFAKKATTIKLYKETKTLVKETVAVSTVRFIAASKGSGFISDYTKYSISKYKYKKTKTFYPNTEIRKVQ